MNFKTLLKGAQSVVEQVFIPKSQTLECTIDDTPIDCADLQENYDQGECFKQDAINYYTGVPAPAYLADDDWFGPAPVRSEKQLDYIEQETIAKQEEEEKRKEYGGGPCSMHQLMYEMATSNWNTVKESQGGSENFQEGPGGWNSGNGWSINKK